MTRRGRLVAVAAGAILAGALVWSGFILKEGAGSSSVVRWRTGDRSAYRVDLRFLMGTSATAIALDLDLSGILNVEPRRMNDDLILKSWLSDASPRNAASKTVASALKRAVFLQFRSTGAFVGVRVSPEAETFVQNVWQAIGAAIQVSGQPDTQGRWTAHESDSIGVYAGDYTKEGLNVGRRKARYISVHQAKAAYSIGESRSTLTLDRSSELQSLDSKEVIRVSLEGLMEVISYTQIRLRKLDGKEARASEDLVASATEIMVPAKPGAPSMDGAALDRARAGGMEVRDVLALLLDSELAFGRREEDEEARKRADRAYVALTALLRLDVNNLALVADHLDRKGPLTDVLLAALRDAGTPAAQEILAKQAARTDLAPGSRMEAARGLRT
jgi:hypothetical protein